MCLHTGTYDLLYAHRDMLMYTEIEKEVYVFLWKSHLVKGGWLFPLQPDSSSHFAEQILLQNQHSEKGCGPGRCVRSISPSPSRSAMFSAKNSECKERQKAEYLQIFEGFLLIRVQSSS